MKLFEKRLACLCIELDLEKTECHMEWEEKEGLLCHGHEDKETSWCSSENTGIHRKYILCLGDHLSKRTVSPVNRIKCF